MKAIRFRSLLSLGWSALALAGLLQTTVSQAQTPPDLSSAFDATAEDWRASTNTATLNWLDTGGTPGGYLRGVGAAGANAWFFVSPASWAGNWSGYQVLKFDFSIPSRHYSDAGQAGMVVIVGNNGQQITWTASTPLWTWTHYEVDLSPEAFGVNQVTFDGIMANVAELRILAEFSTSTETVGLDNVLVTATPPEAHQTDLVSRFTDGIEVGTPVARRPPHRSRRAVFPHRALHGCSPRTDPTLKECPLVWKFDNAG